MSVCRASACRMSACAYHVRPHVLIQIPHVLVACPHVRMAHALRLAETDKMCVCLRGVKHLGANVKYL